MLAGEAFLERIFIDYRSSTSESGSNVWNTALLIGWDEPGGTYDHVPPGPVPPPDPDAPPGELGFTFDRSGYRVPAILVSPWVQQGSVFNDEYRHTSLIATLRKSLEPRRGRSPSVTRQRAPSTTSSASKTPRDPRDLGERRRPPRPGMAPRRGRPRRRTQRPRQEHGTRASSNTPANWESHSRLNSTTPARDHAEAHRRSAQKRRLALLSPPRTVVAGRGGQVGGRYAWSARCSSVKRSPCAAADPALPPPEPRRANAIPTARTAPVSGPAM